MTKRRRREEDAIYLSVSVPYAAHSLESSLEEIRKGLARLEQEANRDEAVVQWSTLQLYTEENGYEVRGVAQGSVYLNRTELHLSAWASLPE